MTGILRRAGLSLAIGLCPMTWALAQSAPATKHALNEERTEDILAREVRHQLAVLPYYSVFDNVVGSVEGNKVTLSGQVLRPTLKADAETAVRTLEGIETVVNRIEVLPVSPKDNELRRAIYRAIFEDASLERYGALAAPPIHIVVKNGSVTLEGWVQNEADQRTAAAKAASVANVSSLRNNLVVRGKERAKK